MADLTPKTSAELGFDAEALEDAWTALVQAGVAKEFGGGVALIVRHGHIALHRATGWAVREPESERTPMATDTIFDLASLTKVMATTPAILRLISENRIGLDQPVGEILPEFGTEGQKADVTIRRLLTHSAGFSAWRDIFLEGRGSAAYLADFARTQPEHTPGAQVIYSDPSFITLGEVVHRLTGESIAEYVAREFLTPLGLTETMYTPPPVLRTRIAGTEMDSVFEFDKAGGREPVKEGGWRRGLIRGEVHDGNAWYGFDGVSGHAGLFGTARDVARYGRTWLNGGALDGVRILPEDLVAEAITDQVHIDGNDERRGYGWALPASPEKAERAPLSGRGVGARGFGHTGFTGTSLWVDPDKDLIMVLLTNRVHPNVNDTYLETRARFTAAVAGAAQ